MWDTLIINPMVNALLLLYQFLGNNFILAIAVFTIIVRVITLPLNIRQQRSSLRMQEMQPQIQAIQKKFRDNPQKMQEEFQKIGYNPAETLAGCLPLLIQFPILIGLYQAIITVLGSTPQQLFELTKRVSDGIDLSQLLPIENTFAWLNLGQPDPLFILPVLVAATMFLQQKLLSPTANKKEDDSKKKGKEEPNPAAAMTQQMLYVMPVMFGFFSLSFPAGLSIYFVLANIIGIGQGYYMRYTMAQEKEAQANRPKPSKKMETEEAVVDQVPMPAPPKNSKNGSSKPEASPPTSKKKNQSKRKRRSAKK